MAVGAFRVQQDGGGGGAGSQPVQVGFGSGAADDQQLWRLLFIWLHQRCLYRSELCLHQAVQAQPGLAQRIGSHMQRGLEARGAPLLVAHQLHGLLDNAVVLAPCGDAVLVHPVPVKERVTAQVLHRKEGVDAHPVVIVLYAGLRVIVAQDPPYPAAIEEAGANEVVLDHIQGVGAARQAHCRAGLVRAVTPAPAGVLEGLAGGVHHRVVRIDQAQAGLGSQALDQGGEHLRRHSVVRGGPGPVFAARLAEAVAERGRQPQVGLVEAADPGVAAGCRHHLLHIVCGAVIDQNQFQAPIGLRQNAGDGVRQEPRLVVNRQHNADQARLQTAARRLHGAGVAGFPGTLPGGYAALQQMLRIPGAQKKPVQPGFEAHGQGQAPPQIPGELVDAEVALLVQMAMAEEPLDGGQEAAFHAAAFRAQGAPSARRLCGWRPCRRHRGRRRAPWPARPCRRPAAAGFPGRWLGCLCR